MNLPYQFGLSNNLLKEYEFNQTQADRVKKLLNLKDSSLIIDICRHYIQNFIPSPIENEDEYWMCSCYPNIKIPLRINIFWHEVFNIHKSNNSDKLNPDWNLMIFTNKDYLSDKIRKQFENKISGLYFDNIYRYDKGLEAQLAVFLPIKYYFTFVENENVYQSIRQYNYELSCKGRRVHKGHNYEFIRLLLNK